jgi:hypothetical protein
VNVRRLHENPLTPAITAGILVSVVTFLLWHPIPVGSAQDDGLYVILGKSLATGHGYRFINLPDAPQAVHYPPGYPALIALLWSLWPHFPANAYLFGVANMVLLGLAAAGAFLLARRVGMPIAVAYVAVFAGFLMPPMLALSTTLMSEPLWLALAIPWLLWAERAGEAQGQPLIRMAALGACAGALMLVRTQSVALVGGIVLILLLRRRWMDAAIVAGGAAIVLLPWQLWVSRYAHLIPDELSGKYGAYNAWVSEGVRMRGLRLFSDAATRNCAIAARLIRGMFSVPGLPALLFTLALLPPAVAGPIRLARRAPVLLAALVAHAALILLFPYDPQRYVWGSWPFILLWLAAGYVQLDEWTRVAGATERAERQRRIKRGLVAASLALVVIGGIVSSGVSVAIGSFRNIAAFGARQLQPTVDWAQQHTATNAVIASDDDAAVYLYTGRHTVPLSVPLASRQLRTDTASPVALDMIVRRYDPDFVMARWTASVAAALQLSQGPAPVLQPIARLETGVVFARVRQDSVR